MQLFSPPCMQWPWIISRYKHLLFPVSGFFPQAQRPIRSRGIALVLHWWRHSRCRNSWSRKNALISWTVGWCKRSSWLTMILMWIFCRRCLTRILRTILIMLFDLSVNMRTNCTPHVFLCTSLFATCLCLLMRQFLLLPCPVGSSLHIVHHLTHALPWMGTIRLPQLPSKTWNSWF